MASGLAKPTLRDAQVHTKSKAKYVHPTFDYHPMSPRRLLHVTNSAIHETHQKRDWGQLVRSVPRAPT
ncbi:hypothetical protein PVK06_039728 [Gossypium arboreum]|uniref:Uncharacterized protein n=1 Tax=Gossypium arboreum TaxID=29729 RepID=A0ABR0N5R3_GOSAR|nr:hypothetical protein PVK06_039728 [Gossypium arboreum]